MMGWASRAREEQEEALGVSTYRVRRWTEFEWNWPRGREKAVRELRDRMKKDRSGHLERAASMITRFLDQKYPELFPNVKLVKVGGGPQLVFTITLRATDENDARLRAMRKFDRGLQVRIPTGRAVQATQPMRGGGFKAGGLRQGTTTLKPPWGKCEVNERKSVAKAA